MMGFDHVDAIVRLERCAIDFQCGGGSTLDLKALDQVIAYGLTIQNHEYQPIVDWCINSLKIMRFPFTSNRGLDTSTTTIRNPCKNYIVSLADLTATN